MIQEIITHYCRCCDSVKNGHNAKGQQHWCKDCNERGALHLRPRFSEDKKEEMLGSCHERLSMRGSSGMFGVSQQIIWEQR